MSYLFWRATNAPPEAFKGQPLPYKDSSLISNFFLNWAGPALRLAYSRNIEANDLKDLSFGLQARTLGDKLESNYMKRVPPSLRSERYRAEENVADKPDSAYDQSLFKAIYFTIWKQWWWMNFTKLLGRE
ncbi:uncharacterized protein L201_007891 [Kwoniella dendrophila CBS 6074]|uniref:Uncharacterized protein n=1 Tax=Kwoniella dendrophila CBS 6074 TaxID=1295534 RepID=A0AAX4K771_9TREE